MENVEGQQLVVGTRVIDKKYGEMKVVDETTFLVKVVPLDPAYEHLIAWTKRSDIKFIDGQWRVKQERRERASGPGITAW